MIATIIAIIAAAIAAVFALGYMGTGFRQRGNTSGYAACIVAAVLFFAAVICAILSLARDWWYLGYLDSNYGRSPMVTKSWMDGDKTCPEKAK